MKGWPLLLLPLAMAGIAFSGWPAFVVLTAGAMGLALVGVASGQLDAALLQALAPRLIGLLEHDLLQALALYALVGALLKRLDLAQDWLRAASRRVGPSMATLGLGLLTAPISGSVGASLPLLRGAADPLLRAHGLAPERRVALIAVASTLGVIVPPSLVLLLLGDALQRAHTEALQQASDSAGQVIHTATLVAATWLPLGLLLAGLALVSGPWRRARAVRTAGRPGPPGPSGPPPAPSRAALGLLSLALPGLLLAVALGWVRAVEGAACAAAALWLWACASGRLRGQHRALLDDALATTGMLFALLMGASACSLVLRGLGTDAWLAQQFAALAQQPQGPAGLLALVLAGLLLCSCVLDAFEILFLVVPIVMPPLLAVQPHAAWVGVLALLSLQLGYLLPPLGFAVLMAGADAGPLSTRGLWRALAPFLAVWVGVIALLLALPELAGPAPQRATPLSGEALQRVLDAAPPDAWPDAPAASSP